MIRNIFCKNLIEGSRGLCYNDLAKYKKEVSGGIGAWMDGDSPGAQRTAGARDPAISAGRELPGAVSARVSRSDGKGLL